MNKVVKVVKRAISLRRQKKLKKYLCDILNVADFNPVVNERLNSIKTITFVIPGMPAFSGGHTSILRLGTELVNLGYEIRYISIDNQSVEDMINNAKINLSGFKGKFISEKFEDVKTDVVIATAWDTVYYSRKINGYKMYFVQDYEPYFSLYGESFILAQKTYELGYHMVSLGQWNKYMIEKECKINSRIDFIEFPYEGKEYVDKNRNFEQYKNKKEFNMAVYIKDTGKRAPYVVQYLCSRLKSDLNKDGITLNLKYYGEDKGFKCEGGINLGKLKKEELVRLYNYSDFGFVGSLTNISLVPYEMLATGLPIIEFEEGTFSYFFPENSAIITNFNYDNFYEQFKIAINNPDIIKERYNISINYLKSLSWKKSALQFKSILDNEVLREF